MVVCHPDLQSGQKGPFSLWDPGANTPWSGQGMGASCGMCQSAVRPHHANLSPSGFWLPRLQMKLAQRAVQLLILVEWAQETWRWWGMPVGSCRSLGRYLTGLSALWQQTLLLYSATIASAMGLWALLNWQSCLGHLGISFLLPSAEGDLPQDKEHATSTFSP